MNSRQQQAPPPDPWLNDIFDYCPDMIVVLDRQGIIRKANQGFQDFCGRSASELPGCNINAFIPAGERDQWTHDLDKLTSGEWTSLDSTLISAQDRAIPFHITLIAHSTCAGHPVNILHLQDASVYRSFERAVLTAQGQWERSFDAIADYMCLLDLSGRILRANLAMTKRFQPLYGKLAGCDYRRIFGGTDTPKKGRALPDTVQTAPFAIPKIQFPNLEGWFAVSSFPLKNEQESITGVVLIVRDITGQEATAAALQKAIANRYQASKMESLGRLAGSIAHDFNNMLTSILGYSSLMLKTTKPDDPRRGDIREIITAAERATAFTRQLLNFSRNHEVETQNVNLNAIIQSLREFMDRTLGENIKLNLLLDSNLANIKADVSRLEQVVVNLVVNARDAMPSGGRLAIKTANLRLDQIFCLTHPDMTPGNYIALEISDTGCGMSAGVRERLFEPFFTTKAKGKGTGLGLTTTYGIVKQFGGFITVYSEIEKGSVFKIYFPESREAGAAAAHVAQDHVFLRGTETIMVVDDEANIVTMVDQMLTKLGYHVLAATSSREALLIGNRHPEKIDMILTDIVMPELNGPDLVLMLRRKQPDLKALYMSGYASNAAVQIGALKHTAAFLQKPFNLGTLTCCIRKVLDASAK